MCWKAKMEKIDWTDNTETWTVEWGIFTLSFSSESAAIIIKEQLNNGELIGIEIERP